MCLILCVNINVHTDLKCNCSDLTCLREGVTSHIRWCNKVFLRGCGVISSSALHHIFFNIHSIKWGGYSVDKKRVHNFVNIKGQLWANIR